jgi:hypothetical protein
MCGGAIHAASRDEANFPGCARQSREHATCARGAKKSGHREAGASGSSIRHDPGDPASNGRIKKEKYLTLKVGAGSRLEIVKIKTKKKRLW